MLQSLTLWRRATELVLLTIFASNGGVASFAVLPITARSLGAGCISSAAVTVPRILPLFMSENSKPESSREENASIVADQESRQAEHDQKKAKKEFIGNLVADDEWDGFGLELSDLITKAVVEDVKRQLRTFTGKENLKVGDLSKEVDRRVKDKVAKLRNKSEYELFDLTLALDEIAKNYTETLTGKPYEPGDLSIELDKRIKAKVAEFCSKDTYEFGDLTKEMLRRIERRTLEFVNKSESGKPYEFGDISREIENRRRQWVKDYLGEEAAANYSFGDITKKAVSGWIGKPTEEYKFGDLTKTLFQKLFGEGKGKEES